jgi:hypothetical protein
MNGRSEFTLYNTHVNSKNGHIAIQKESYVETLMRDPRERVPQSYGAVNRNIGLNSKTKPKEDVRGNKSIFG